MEADVSSHSGLKYERTPESSRRTSTEAVADIALTDSEPDIVRDDLRINL
jgi:hypothetical protein